MGAPQESDVLKWCAEGRSVFWRIPLFVYGIFLFGKILWHPDFFTPIDFLDLAIHEMGHMIFMPFGEWIGVAGGSIAQVLAPIYGAWQFLRQRDYFAAAFSLAWLAESLANLSVYIGDARRQELPLANLFGGDPIHDWNYILGSLHRLPFDATYAWRIRAAAFLCLCAFLWIGGWLLLQIWRGARRTLA